MSTSEATNGAARGAPPRAVAPPTFRMLHAGFRELADVSAIFIVLEAAVRDVGGADWKRRTA